MEEVTSATTTTADCLLILIPPLVLEVKGFSLTLAGNCSLLVSSGTFATNTLCLLFWRGSVLLISPSVRSASSKLRAGGSCSLPVSDQSGELSLCETVWLWFKPVPKLVESFLLVRFAVSDNDRSCWYFCSVQSALLKCLWSRNNVSVYIKRVSKSTVHLIVYCIITPEMG